MSIFKKIKENVKKSKSKKEEVATDSNLKENNIDNSSESSENGEISLEAKFAEKELELAELKDKYLRIFAEFDNFKKRSSKEKMEFMRNASQDVLIDILPVLDDFDRAKQSSDDSNTDENFTEGVTLVYNKLHNVVKSKGLVAMDSNGVEFDAELHEAITKIPAPTAEYKGKVIDTIQRGYYLNDKIIRHAKVVVGE